MGFRCIVFVDLPFDEKGFVSGTLVNEASKDQAGSSVFSDHHRYPPEEFGWSSSDCAFSYIRRFLLIQ